MRSVLIGAVESSRQALASMIAAGHPPALVVSLPPARAQRHSDYVDLGAISRATGIEVFEAINVNAPEVAARVREVAPDLVFVIGWSQVCSPEFLALASLGAIGYHPSLLPQDRGRAVIPWTILQGRSQTGSTLFWMSEGTDDGDILAQERVAVAADETARSLYDKHMIALDRILQTALRELAAGRTPRTPQDHARATYCSKRTAADGLIDWTKSAREVWTLIRAVGAPYPPAHTYSGRRKLGVLRSALVGRAPYAGLAGQIQRLDADGALVQCGDGEHVLLTVVSADDVPVPPRDMLKIHEKLGIDLQELMTRSGGVAR